MTDAPIRRETFTYAHGLALDYACGPGRPSALVVYAHGGSFLTGNRQDRLARHYAGVLAARGLAFASIDYRKGGHPLRALPPHLPPVVGEALARSGQYYPETTTRLFGPLLYRAAQDLGTAVHWLRQDPAGPALGDVPLVVMGLSAGGIAALGYAYGLDGTEPPAATPVLAIGVAAVPPQPWRITAGHPTPGAILIARGDAIMPRAAIARLTADMVARACPLEVRTIPYGQHNRPVRELLPGEGEAQGAWQGWLLAKIGAQGHAAEPRQDGLDGKL